MQVARSYSNLAMNYMKLNEINQAIKYFTKSLRIKKALDNEDYESVNIFIFY